jgi:methionyl aminopeptidase
MIYLKNENEVRAIREGGKRLSVILKKLLKSVKPGVSSLALEKMANEEIKNCGGSSAFKNYPMGGGIFFPSTLCVSINNEVVHGAAFPERIIKAGDIVDLDIGMEWPVEASLREQYILPINKYSKKGGFFTDTCATVGAGAISREAKKLLNVSRECLMLAIKKVKPGNKLNDIGKAVEDYAEKHGYGVVRDLVGHGVGYFAHEAPDVFNFTIADNSPDNITLEAGMVIAIEPMINLGGERVKIAKNGYTVLTADNSLSAHFEHTVLITKTGVEIIT